MKDIIIVGAGGVGKETAWIIEQINTKNNTWNIIGFLDDNEELWNSKINGYYVLGGLDYLNSLDKKTFLIVAIANYNIKKNIIKKLKGRFQFATVIHPDVYISSSVSVGIGTIIYPGVIMTTNISIGNHVIVSPKCGIGHDSIIKDYVSLLWNVNISGFDIIEEGVLIGSGATIVQNKTIGRESIVGAGAVVIKDIDNYLIVAGIPANKLNKRG